MAIYNNVTELIGKTPILNLNNFAKEQGAQANILAKLEYFNPAGSVKDRIANAMISAAEADGTLKPGAPADLIQVDLGAPVIVSESDMVSKSKNTPFEGARFQGRGGGPCDGCRSGSG
jgi:hypothetical protein